MQGLPCWPLCPIPWGLNECPHACSKRGCALSALRSFKSRSDLPMPTPRPAIEESCLLQHKAEFCLWDGSGALNLGLQEVTICWRLWCFWVAVTQMRGLLKVLSASGSVVTGSLPSLRWAEVPACSFAADRASLGYSSYCKFLFVFNGNKSLLLCRAVIALSENLFEEQWNTLYKVEM